MVFNQTMLLTLSSHVPCTSAYTKKSPKHVHFDMDSSLDFSSDATPLMMTTHSRGLPCAPHGVFAMCNGTSMETSIFYPC